MSNSQHGKYKIIHFFLAVKYETQEMRERVLQKSTLIFQKKSM